MSNESQKSQESFREPVDATTTNSQPQEPQSNEIGWLVSGLLILVLGIGGALMFSQEKDLYVGSAKPVATDQFNQGFPTPALASQNQIPPPSQDAPVLPVSTAEGIISPDGGSNREDIKEKVVFFDYDQAVLSDKAKARLAPQGQLEFEEHKTILVRGHTDRKGSEGYNRTLSIRRAKAVKEYLVNLGHQEDSIHVEGLGKDQPVCREFTDACAAQNRRVNVYFSEPDSKGPNSEPLMTKSISGSDQNSPATIQTTTESAESEPEAKIETVQLAESAEEIIPPDPIASVTKSQ